jgi:hypothetical protein
MTQKRLHYHKVLYAELRQAFWSLLSLTVAGKCCILAEEELVKHVVIRC